MSRIVEAINKPRLMKWGSGWLCIGMRRRLISSEFVMTTGNTPGAAYEAWYRINCKPHVLPGCTGA